MNTIGLTLAGLTIALVVLYANVRPWWKGNRDPKQLAPFGQGALLGGLATTCVGGILGWGAKRAANLANSAGDKATLGITGTQAESPITTARLGTLTPEGAVIVVLILTAVVLAFRAAGKADKRRIAGGAFVGATLCTTAGVAGFLAWVPDSVNTAGTALRSAIEGAGIL
ncbi:MULTISPECIES: hypothetical protein [Actinomycetes]|uniref:hypothetical protein n=1 Tax=Actinomycetes TaxID=1760 RepID=UPI0033EA6E02